MRKQMVILGGLVVAAVFAAAAYFAVAPRPAHISPAMVNVDGAAIGGPFEMTTHKGERVTSADVIDGPTLIYFGYTFCPDVCPVDSQIMADAVDLLAERGIEVTPVFVTVDPARDTPTELGYFVEGLHPEMVGLTGSEADVSGAADAYKVYYEKVELQDSAAGYLMNHTGYTYLMTPEKGITALFRREFPPEQIADDIEKVLNAL